MKNLIKDIIKNIKNNDFLKKNIIELRYSDNNNKFYIKLKNKTIYEFEVILYMKNLVPLDYLLKRINNIDKLKNNIIEVGYANYPKKYFVKFKNNKIVKFGHQDYEDSLYREYKKIDRNYIEERKKLYRERHNKDKHLPIYTPGFLSYYILW